MIVAVTAKNLTISPASRRLIVACDQHLRRYFKRIFSINWSFETEQQHLEAHLFVHARSGDYFASAVGETFREVVAAASKIIESQRRRRKKIANRQRRPKAIQLADLEAVAHAEARNEQTIESFRRDTVS